MGFWQWNVNKLCFEYDTDPYYQALDKKVKVTTIHFHFLLEEHYFSFL